MRLLDVNPASNTQVLVARQLFRPVQSPNPVRQVFQMHPQFYYFAPGRIPKLQIMPHDAQTRGDITDLLLGSRGYSLDSPGQEPILIKNLDFRLPTKEVPGALNGLIREPAAKFLPPGYELHSDFVAGLSFKAEGGQPGEESE